MKKLILAVVPFVVLCSAKIEATPITYTAFLSGADEFPPNASPGSGQATVVIDTIAHMLEVDVNFADLLGTTTASHIHCCTAASLTGNAGVATQLPTFTGFPLGVTSGTYSHFFDLTLSSSWNPAFIAAHGGTPAGAEAALAAGLAAERSYLNIHTNQFPGGEIRGFLVPEPATLGLIAVGLGTLVVSRRRRRA